MTVLSIVVAFGALIVSLVTLYVTTLKTLDEVQVVISWSPNVTMQGTNFTTPKFQVSDDQIMTFVNAGTQPAAIIGISLFVVDAPEGVDCQHLAEKTMGAQRYPYDFEHLVLEPHTIVTKSVKLRLSDNKTAPVFEPMFNSEQKKITQWRILTCFNFNVVVPNKQITAWVHGGDHHFFRDGGGSSKPVVDKLETLVKRVSTVFST